MSKVPPTVRIVIADDHALFREALHLLLETEPGFCVVGEANDGSAVAKLLKKVRPDILLLDLSMPGLSGMEALRELSTAESSVRTIVLAGHIGESQMSKAIELGAYGVVPKESASKVLLQAIRAVLAGHYWVGPEGVSGLARTVRRLSNAPASPRDRLYGLTPRELEVVAVIVAGSTNRDIAAKFSVREDTVKHHITNIFEKVGVSNRLELALFAISKGLVSEHR